MAIDRCVCRDVLFADLKRLAERLGPDVDALSRRTGCGTNCGLCLPYIRVMLATGRTDLPVMSDEEIRRVLEGASGSGKENGPG